MDRKTRNVFKRRRGEWEERRRYDGRPEELTGASRVRNNGSRTSLHPSPSPVRVLTKKGEPNRLSHPRSYAFGCSSSVISPLAMANLVKPATL
jgi:hypothetical protein